MHLSKHKVVSMCMRETVEEQRRLGLLSWLGFCFYM